MTDSVTAIYIYDPPPVEEREIPEGTVDIELPAKEGIPVTVLTYENGMTAYLYRESGDYKAADRLVAWAGQNLHTNVKLLGFPSSHNPDMLTWVPVNTFTRLLNIHDAVSTSPLAKEEMRGDRPKVIHVPMGDQTVVLPMHGSGKRRR